MSIPKEILLGMYRRVLLARKFDDKLYELNQRGIDWGGTGLHLGAGQEAMPVAVGAILRQDDYVKISRGWNVAIGKGIPVKLLMASTMRRKVEGERPVSSTYAPEYGLMGISGSLGEDIPIYVGMALSSKIKGEKRVTVCFFGDGTSNRGPVHESVNLAAIWKLPVVFICENNQYAISLHVSKSVAAADIAARAAGYGIPGVAVGGNDVIACYEVAYDAIKRAREGNGPSFIEVKTYRLRAHFEGDSQTYRSKEEVEEAWKREPVGRFRSDLLKAGMITEEEAGRYDAEAAAEIEEAVRYADSLPRINPEELLARLQS